MNTKPRLRLYTPKPYRAKNKKITATDFKIYWNRDWRVIYKYNFGRFAGLYCFKNGNDKEIRFRTLNELTKDIT